MPAFFTYGVAAAGCAAQCCPLQVEAVFAALAMAALCVSLTVDTVQSPGVPKAVPRSPVAAAALYRCKRSEVNVDGDLCWHEGNLTSFHLTVGTKSEFSFS